MCNVYVSMSMVKDNVFSSNGGVCVCVLIEISIFTWSMPHWQHVDVGRVDGVMRLPGRFFSTDLNPEYFPIY